MDNQEVVYSDAVFIAAEERLSMRQECSTGICAKCRFWRVIELTYQAWIEKVYED